MILALPEKFNSNEWFIIISIIIAYTLMFLLPKRFPLSVTLIMLMFSMTYVQVIDHILAGISFNLYDINDVQKYEWFDLFIWFLYPPFGYTFIYFFDKWPTRGVAVFWYIILWTFLAMGEEFLSIKFNIYRYEKWRLAYSYPVYLITLSIYLLTFLYIKNAFEKLKKESDLV